MLEHVLVEKLAINLWRYRRFLRAESAAARRNIVLLVEENAEKPTEFDLVDPKEKQLAETNRMGALSHIAIPEMLEFCLDKLSLVSEAAEMYGLDHPAFLVHLGIMYGARYSGWEGKDLFDFYLAARVPQRRQSNHSRKREERIRVET
jgi:hypothetical protein